MLGSKFGKMKATHLRNVDVALSNIVQIPYSQISQIRVSGLTSVGGTRQHTDLTHFTAIAAMLLATIRDILCSQKSLIASWYDKKEKSDPYFSKKT